MTLGAVLGVALGGSLAAYMLSKLALALRSGAMATRGGYIYRQIQPGDFWFAVAIYGVLTGIWVGLTVWIFVGQFS